MAIACSRLVTFPPLPPLPDRKVPRFSRRMALSTLLLAASPYFLVDFLRKLFLTAMTNLLSLRGGGLPAGCRASQGLRAMRFGTILDCSTVAWANCGRAQVSCHPASAEGHEFTRAALH